ncbi:MAG: MAPEG family protein [Gammaproteobacteria bacterium]|nr:MAPEG family protein [Gammaproteobacteria bacterium]
MHTPSLSILYPFLAMVGLTLLVWVWMYITRTRVVITGRLGMDDFQSAGQKEPFPSDVRYAGENFSNLFEMPVLFYALSILLYITHTVTETQITLAWWYVAFRAVHSLIHCSYNKVLHRLSIYLISSLVLWGMWGMFAYEILINTLVQV